MAISANNVLDKKLNKFNLNTKTKANYLQNMIDTQ